ncbi:hypothetical protein ACVWZ4_003356 [Bradyrhizobium sp. USDA 4472]
MCSGASATEARRLGPHFVVGYSSFPEVARNAGVDLLLVAYDGAQFYRIFGCALDGSRQGKLDAEMLRASAARLGRGLPIEQASHVTGLAGQPFAR